MNRREFLRSVIIQGGALYVGSTLLSNLSARANGPRQFLVLGHTEARDADYIDRVNRLAKSVPGEVRILDLANLQLRKLEVPLFCHGFAQSPKDANIVVGIEKWAERAAVIDLKNAQLMKTLQAQQGYRFFGHCVFSPKGDKLFVSASHYEGNLGAVLVYRTSDWSFDHIMPIGKGQPHDIQLEEGNENLIVALQKKTEAHLVEVLLASEKYKSLSTVPVANHLLKIHPDLYVVGSIKDKNTPLAAYVVNFKKKDYISIKDAKGFSPEYIGEALSLAKYDDEHVLVTTSVSNRLLLWNITKNELHERVTPGMALGVVKIDSRILVNSGQSGLLQEVYYKATSNEFTSLAEVKPAVGNGRHMYHFTV